MVLSVFIYQDTHNRNVITRILKFLGDFKLEDYQLSWLEFLYIEIFENCELKDLWNSYAEFWIHT